MRHGEPAGYQAGCREQCCLVAKAREAKQRRLLVARGHEFQVDCARSRRKVQALAAMGWSAKHVGALLGITQQAMSRILARDTIRATTAERIDRAYDALEMKVPPDDEWTRRTKNRARKEGWQPPLAWDDIDAGILAGGLSAESVYTHQRLDLDEVEYALQYHDFSRRLSPLEKAEIVRRWKRDGRSERSLCQLTGWREGRYRTTTPTTQEAP